MQSLASRPIRGARATHPRREGAKGAEVATRGARKEEEAKGTRKEEEAEATSGALPPGGCERRDIKAQRRHFGLYGATGSDQSSRGALLARVGAMASSLCPSWLRELLLGAPPPPPPPPPLMHCALAASAVLWLAEAWLAARQLRAVAAARAVPQELKGLLAEDKFVKGRVYALDRGRFGLVRCARSSCVATRRGECACARLRRCLQL